MNGKSRLRALAGAVLVIVSAGRAAGQAPVKLANSYDELYARYLRQARTTPQTVPPDPWGWMNGLAVDSRARRINDLIGIRV